MVLVDTLYFRTWDDATRALEPVVTPWNAFDYNRQSENLRAHGLHPRATHVALNMPMLFGSLFLFDFMSLACEVYSLNWNTVVLSIRTRPIRAVSLATVTLQLAVLSVAPHQEARFLLPLLLPMILLFGDRPFEMLWRGTQSKRFSCFRPIVWCAFNLVMAIFYGCVHQAGVVPSLAHLATKVSEDSLANATSVAIVFHDTYMPPWHMLGVSTASSLALIDLGEMDLSEPCRSLRESLEWKALIERARNVAAIDEPIEDAKDEGIIVYSVGPPWRSDVLYDCFESNSDYREYSRRRIRCFGPHFSGEAPGRTAADVIRGLCVEEIRLREHERKFRVGAIGNDN